MNQKLRFIRLIVKVIKNEIMLVLYIIYLVSLIELTHALVEQMMAASAA